MRSFISRHKMAAKAAGVVMVAGVTALASAGNAFATNYTVHTTDSGVYGGDGTFNSSNQTLTACDNQGDGLRVWAQLWHETSSGTHQYVTTVEETRGAGNCHSVPTYSFTSGTTLKIKVCLKNGSAGALQYCATGPAKA